MVIASSLLPSEWPDLTGVFLQPLWLSVLFSHSHYLSLYSKSLEHFLNGLIDSSSYTSQQWQQSFSAKKQSSLRQHFISASLKITSITRLDALQLCYTIWCIVIDMCAWARTMWASMCGPRTERNRKLVNGRVGYRLRFTRYRCQIDTVKTVTVPEPILIKKKNIPINNWIGNKH